jgi:hypothetical protein
MSREEVFEEMTKLSAGVAAIGLLVTLIGIEFNIKVLTDTIILCVPVIICICIVVLVFVYLVIEDVFKKFFFDFFVKPTRNLYRYWKSYRSREEFKSLKEEFQDAD